jgi:cob(I)alamin adenosyltransferase
MKIYTKTGDQGQTSLLGGMRVPKHHLKIEAYGTVDELNSYLGLVRDVAGDKHSIETIIKIQNSLFTIGAQLATETGNEKVKIPHIQVSDIEFLEKEIDAMDAQLPPLKNFVLPGGNTWVSHCHVARCICRRAERLVVHLSENEKIDEQIISYLNRLSDYLFVLSRYAALKTNANEIPWIVR